MKLDLKEFIDATTELHRRSGVKHTRLMLRLRPYSARKNFIVKATDGNITFTTRVEHMDQLKPLEKLVSDFVTKCTAASVPPPPPPPSSSTPAGSSANATTGSAAAGDCGESSGTQQQQQQQGGAAAGRKGQQQQQQQSSSANNKKSGKGKKGKR